MKNLLILLALLSFNASAATSTLYHNGFVKNVTDTNRTYYYKLPANPPTRAVILLHASRAFGDWLIDEPIFKPLIDGLIAKNIAVIIPSARTEFNAGGWLWPRWETETKTNPDTDFIGYIVDHEIASYNKSGGKIKKIDLVGVSGGALMADRMVQLRGGFNSYTMVQGCGADGAVLINDRPVFNNNYTVKKGLPPLMSVSTSIDDLVITDAKRAYIEKSRNAGNAVIFIEKDGGSHADWQFMQSNFSNIINFISIK